MTCSYCSAQATYIGKGEDGDGYCNNHLMYAYNGASIIS